MSHSKENFRQAILAGIPDQIPAKKQFDPKANHAPKRKDILSVSEKRLTLKNALRYFPEHLHRNLAPEFLNELKRFGRIYMYRYQPEYQMYARPIEEYPAKSKYIYSV